VTGLLVCLAHMHVNGSQRYAAPPNGPNPATWRDSSGTCVGSLEHFRNAAPKWSQTDIENVNFPRSASSESENSSVI
jgi:hypothetical protein